ncbi:MAG: hypothetical protein ABJ081_03565 [Hyphomicrobiales bacterium]
MYKIAKNPLVGSAITAAALSIAAFTTPIHSREPSCTAELQSINSLLENTKLRPAIMFKVDALRKSAIARNSQGDAEGCMQDVKDIKALIGS